MVLSRRLELLLDGFSNHCLYQIGLRQDKMEPQERIELSSPAYQAGILPLNYGGKWRRYGGSNSDYQLERLASWPIRR